MGVVDFHVHCRGLREGDGEADYIGHVLRVVELAGVDAIGDMPNPKIPITTRKLVIERLNVARSYGSDVFYGLHIGMTPDPEQIREAVEVYREFFPKVGDRVGAIGLKMYAGRSTGNLEIIDVDKQRSVYETLGKCGYDGVLAVHCEKESLMRPEFWNPKEPMSHSLARPAEVEVESVRDQIRFAYEGGLKALHIAHVSTFEAVELVDIARRNYGNSDVRSMKVTCGVTPHHLFLNNEMRTGEDGLLWKVNPPLRSKSEQDALLRCLNSGLINCVESDHAPHHLKNKMGEPYLSGIPGLDSWPKVLERLRREGFTEGRVRRLTRDNILGIYGIPNGVVKDSEGVGDMGLNEYAYGYGEELLG
jgi:dihydroorotase